MDQSEFLRLATPVTQENADMSDPRQHAAWALRSFPSPNKQMGDVPVSPPVPEDLSERLHAFGFRHHPEEQTLFLLPGEHPEGGFLNVPKVVSRKEYEEYWAARADTDTAAATWTDTARSLLGDLNPKLLARIDAMTDEEKFAAAEVQREQMPAAFRRLEEIAKQSKEGGAQ